METAGESAEDLHSARPAPAALREAADIVNRLVQQRQVHWITTKSSIVLLDAPAMYVSTTPLILLLALTACDRLCPGVAACLVAGLVLLQGVVCRSGLDLLHMSRLQARVADQLEAGDLDGWTCSYALSNRCTTQACLITACLSARCMTHCRQLLGEFVKCARQRPFIPACDMQSTKCC